MTPAPQDQRFPKSLRITRKADFDRIYSVRRAVSDDCLVINGCRNELDHPRLGLAISRRAGNAVVRNLWKRRIREAFRLYRAELPVGIDLVVSTRRPTPASFAEIRGSLIRLAKRLVKRLAS